MRRYPRSEADADLTVISLGAGVQSTALLLLALEGRIHADCAVFADTRWEPRAVYEHVDRLREHCADVGFPLHVVSKGDLRAASLREHSPTALPVYTRDASGKDGIGKRSCTRDFKIRIVQGKARELLGGRTRGKHVDMVLGISLDEAAARMTDSKVGWASNVYPLVDLGWRRNNCDDYNAERGFPAPRSACIACPFRSDAHWVALDLDEQEAAVQYEHELQAATGLDSAVFLHKQRRPLRDVLTELRTTAADDISLLDAECSGHCHT